MAPGGIEPPRADSKVGSRVSAGFASLTTAGYLGVLGGDAVVVVSVVLGGSCCPQLLLRWPSGRPHPSWERAFDDGERLTQQRKSDVAPLSNPPRQRLRRKVSDEPCVNSLAGTNTSSATAAWSLPASVAGCGPGGYVLTTTRAS